MGQAHTKFIIHNPQEKGKSQKKKIGTFVKFSLREIQNAEPRQEFGILHGVAADCGISWIGLWLTPFL